MSEVARLYGPNGSNGNGVGGAEGATVKLTTAEQKIVRYIASSRSAANRRAGVVDARVGPQGSEHSDIIGFAAELAFAKLFNVYPDFTIEPRRGSVDCWRLGETIDVKATTYPKGRLLAVPNKQVLAADVYALVIVEWAYQEPDAEAICRFAGFARAADLLAPERLTDLGHGPTYALDQRELSPVQACLPGLT